MWRYCYHDILYIHISLYRCPVSVVSGVTRSGRLLYMLSCHMRLAVHIRVRITVFCLIREIQICRFLPVTVCVSCGLLRSSCLRFFHRLFCLRRFFLLWCRFYLFRPSLSMSFAPLPSGLSPVRSLAVTSAAFSVATSDLCCRRSSALTSSDTGSVCSARVSHHMPPGTLPYSFQVHLTIRTADLFHAAHDLLKTFCHKKLHRIVASGHVRVPSASKIFRIHKIRNLHSEHCHRILDLFVCNTQFFFQDIFYIFRKCSEFVFHFGNVYERKRRCGWHT